MNVEIRKPTTIQNVQKEDRRLTSTSVSIMNNLWFSTSGIITIASFGKFSSV